MRLILVRHGETIENKQHILQGQTHGKLTEKGVSRTKELADYLTSIEMDICFTSDLQRAVDTASIIASKNPGMKLIKDIRLRERYLGDLQGKPIPDNWNGMNYHENAEPMEKLIERVKSFIADIQLNHGEDRVLIVSHGITLKTIVSVCLGDDEVQFNEIAEFENCSVSVLEKTSKDSQFSLIDKNNTFYTSLGTIRENMSSTSSIESAVSTP